jgi:adenylosuccinate synthase
MKRFAVVGMQWGDEGKGKMTDFLALEADVIIRYQGGDNAGHTVMYDDQKVSLHLLPSGVIHPHTVNILGHGMVINLESLFKEIAPFKSSHIYISDRAHVILPFHKTLDAIAEEKQNIGTTKKGIGPTYADKILRKGVRVASLLSKERFIKDAHALALSHGLDFDAKAYYETHEESIAFILNKIVYVPNLLQTFIKDNKKMVFEGAQGVMLDIDHGTYPYVTSSSPSVSGIAQAIGCAPWHIEGALGIMKAYSTRVGEGPFPTEILSPLAHQIREVAREYGTTTGRPRRIGYLDLVQLKHTVISSGISHIAMTLLDIIKEMDEILVCYAYDFNGVTIDYMPAHIDDVASVKPIYHRMPSFKEDISNVLNFNDLPKEALAYIAYIENYLGIDVAYVSVGPKRNQTIKRLNLWEV